MTGPIKITITEREWEISERVADIRDREGKKASADDYKFGDAGTDSWELHLQGVVFELVAAKALNRYPSGYMNSYADDDDLGGIQIRGTLRPDGRLLLRPFDFQSEGSEDRRFVLVRWKEDRTFEVAGYAFGREVKKDRYLYSGNGRPPCWLYPVSQLRDANELCTSS